MDEQMGGVEERRTKSALNKKAIVVVAGAFLLFFFALELMIQAFDALGSETIHSVLTATANPFTGLFIGLLITAIIQSSSTTTALVVTLVGSGSLTLLNAVPVIMGANLGTTITALIVSLGFLNKPGDFKRAVSAAAYHCFFNLLTIVILFPLEYHYGFITSLASWLSAFVAGSEISGGTESISWSLFGFIVDPIVSNVNAPVVLVIVSFFLLFLSILFFRRQISNLIISRSDSTGKLFFKDPVKSLGWGLIITAAIRSSTITTSLVVPLVARKIIKLREAATFIMGANVGTTITGFIAVLVTVNSFGAVSIALSHLLFNIAGVLLFFVLPFLPSMPYYLSQQLGILSARFRLSVVIFVLLTFFILPFSLIYFSSF